MESFWGSFHLDPRAPENASMRASDADREAVRSMLGEAYADGRLSREEYDERLETLLSTRTLGELPPLVADLVSPTQGGPPVRPAVTSAQAELRKRASAAYWRAVQEALSGFLVPSLITVVIWFVAGHGFFWPVFIMLGTGINLVQTVVRRESIIDREVARLEKKEARKPPPPPPPSNGEGER